MESDPIPIRDEFVDEQLLHINTATPWFVDIYNFVPASQFPLEASQLYKERLKSDAKCIPDIEIKLVLQFCHAASGGGHYRSIQTTRKVLDCGFYWPTIFKDAYQFISTCKKCQKVGMIISRRHEIPQQPILFYELFNAIATKTNDAKVVVDFMKSNIFCRFGVPKALISDQGSYFCNRAMSSLLHKYEVVHQVATAYQP
ncbi:putative mitochondrial protein, partial [Mucuna pruriens]